MYLLYVLAICTCFMYLPYGPHMLTTNFVTSELPHHTPLVTGSSALISRPSKSHVEDNIFRLKISKTVNSSLTTVHSGDFITMVMERPVVRGLSC